MKTRKSRAGMLKTLRAIRDEMNEELAGKSFVEQQRYVRERLKAAGISVPRGRHRRQRTA